MVDADGEPTTSLKHALQMARISLWDAKNHLEETRGTLARGISETIRLVGKALDSIPEQDEQTVYTDPSGRVWHPHRGYWCFKTATENAKLRAALDSLERLFDEMASTKDASAEVISWMQFASGAVRDARYDGLNPADRGST